MKHTISGISGTPLHKAQRESGRLAWRAKRFDGIGIREATKLETATKKWEMHDGYNI